MNDWDDLRVFLAVCREGSVNRAASRLGVSHTTVLRRVKAFETDLGTRLFDRTKGGYAMTDTARVMLTHATAVEGEIQTLRRKVDGLDAQLRGPVRVTTSPEISNHLLVRKVDEFRTRYPEIELQLMETMRPLDLDAREADLAIRLTDSPPPALIGRRVRPLLQAVYSASPSDTGENLVLYGYEQLHDGWSERFPNGRVALRTDSPTAMQTAVLAGVGIARLPCFMAEPDPRLHRLGDALEPDGWAIWVLTHPDVRTSARVKACRSFLIEALETEVPAVLPPRSPR